MIGREPTTVLDQVAAAKRYAALSGPFRPMDAVAALADVDGIDATIAIMAHLASVCDTQSADEATWLMRGPDRHWILGQLAEQGVLATAVADRRGQISVDQGTADLLDAIEGVDAFAEGVVADAATSGPLGEDLQRLAIALERAGPIAPAYGHLETARARLAGSEATARRRLLLRDGFFGRAAELRRIADWIARPASTTPLKGLFITGAPGIGKSTLLDEAVGRALDSDPARTLVRLDFDRAGLDARDWIGLTIELARQVANDVPQAASAIRDARQVAASEDLGGVRKKGDVSREQVPSALAALVRDMLERDGRTLLVVLDTMEVLRGRASTHPDRVFAWLDQLVRQGMVPLAILAAGRGNAFEEASWRIDEPIRLAGLEGPDVDRMLDRLDVPAASYADVRRVAEGNPLAVRLAARVIEKNGPQALADAKPGEGVAAGLLYRILLARIDDDEVRALAHPGLVVRRIDAAVVGEVLGPQLGMGTIPPQRAEKLFETLAEQHWLVEDDPLTGFVRHRPDIRRQMLPLLYREDPRGCARIDRAAAAWFAKRPEPWCAVEVAYHRLQGLRRSTTVPQLDPQVLRQLDADAIDELPAAAQDVVRRARGERSTQFRGVGLEPGAPLDPSATVELRGVVDKGDWLEGRYVYQQTFAVAMFDARSPDADVARAYLWRSGQWTEAMRLDSERRRLGGVDIPAPDASPVVALVRLEMWAESRFGSLVTNLVHEPGLAARAAELRQRAVTTDLVTGALGFALRRTGPLTAPPPSVQQDSVGTAFATWAPSLAVTGEAVEGTSISRRRLDSVALLPPDFDDRGDAAIARLLAVETPYATTVAALMQLRDGGEDRTSGAGVLAEHLASVTDGMRRIGALGTFGQRWEVALEPAGSAGRSVEQLTSLGLLAEWLGAAGLISRDRDVQLIAAAAERWRRTTAGRWSYARRPHGAGARWANAVDVTLADRVSSLESAGSDAEGASLEQLGAWAMNGEAETLLAQLERRYRRLVAEQAGRPSPDVAAALLARHVPSAFVPPLAVLVSRRGGIQPAAVVARGPSTAKASLDPARLHSIESRSERGTTMADERIERVTARLKASPQLRAAIEAAFASNTVPPSIAAAISASALESMNDGSGRLESVLPPASLEAIVQRFGRPPLVVRNDTVILEPLPDLPIGTDALIKGVEPAVRSVGRVEFLNFRMPWGGTGWVIDGTGNERTIATNRHVAKLVARRISDGRGVFLRSPTSGVQYAMQIDFREEVDSTPEDAFEVKVTDILYLADDTAADVALVRVTGKGLPSPLPLANQEAKAGDLVALIGYPAFDDRNDLNDQARYFKDLFEIKRFAPGRVMQALSGSTILSHDCTSLGGNSGSPLIRLSDGAVVGLHFAGVYGVENSAVGVGTLRSLVKGERPVAVAVVESLPEARKDGIHKPTDFDGREGYDPAFLDGVKAPWPKLPAAIRADLAKPSDASASRPAELRYTHFGVLFSTSRKQPVMTGVNIDGAHTVRIKRSDDRWFTDLRIPASIQLGQDDYDDPQIDRGHMVRREDPNWDPAVTPGPDVTSTLAEQANFDTFHYTNSAVQHWALNQGKQLWLGLESYVLDNARTHGFRACVFSGPVNRDDDPEVKPGVMAPREFWKLVAMVDAETRKLHATAYLLSQGDLIRELLERRSKIEAVEGFVLSEYRTFQIAIRDLADATGYDFSAYTKADPLAKSKPGQEAVASDEPLFVPLVSLRDVVM